MSPTIEAVMPGAYIDARGALSIRERPVPVAVTGTALLRTIVSSVCGSDLHRFRGAQSYGADTDVFGHETVAEVVSCPGGEFLPGTCVLHVPFPADGRVFARHQLGDVHQLIEVPEGLDPTSAVFAQQLGTIVFALRNYWPDAVPPRSAFVAGCGPAGVMFVQLLRHLGCHVVHAVDPNAYRRGLAERFGAIAGEPAVSVELAVDTSGAASGRALCGRVTRPGGTVGVFGLPDDEPGDLGIPVLDLLGRNLRVVGAMGAQGEAGLASFRAALDLIASGAVRVEELVTHRGVLDDLRDLCEAATRVDDDVAKVLIEFPDPAGDMVSAWQGDLA